MLRPYLHRLAGLDLDLHPAAVRSDLWTVVADGGHAPLVPLDLRAQVALRQFRTARHSAQRRSDPLLWQEKKEDDGVGGGGSGWKGERLNDLLDRSW